MFSTIRIFNLFLTKEVNEAHIFYYKELNSKIIFSYIAPTNRVLCYSVLHYMLVD
ncbi:hypothetical protein CCPUN_09000 [Cardinium endosymbiont of Culicoides punctatus]|nr:hypothetical protein CCPUN_09000 [Cardinium endosymbiont of Culicoides punctatus]